MKIFVTGPMRGKQDLNRPAFAKATLRLRGVGYEVISPSELDDIELKQGKPLDVNHALLRDLGYIVDCQAMAVLPNWQSSAGATGEIRFALGLSPPLKIIDARTEEPVDPLHLLPYQPVTPIRKFETGAQRSSRAGRGRYDLLPMRGIHQIALVLESGAMNYNERNWEKGMPISDLLDSAFRHLAAFLVGHSLAGSPGDDNLAQFAWNALVALDIRERVRDGSIDSELYDVGPDLK